MSQRSHEFPRRNAERFGAVSDGPIIMRHNIQNMREKLRVSAIFSPQLPRAVPVFSAATRRDRFADVQGERCPQAPQSLAAIPMLGAMIRAGRDSGAVQYGQTNGRIRLVPMLPARPRRPVGFLAALPQQVLIA